MEEVSNIFKGALPNSATSRTHPHFPQSPPTTQKKCPTDPRLSKIMSLKRLPTPENTLSCHPAKIMMSQLPHTPN